MQTWQQLHKYLDIYLLIKFGGRFCVSNKLVHLLAGFVFFFYLKQGNKSAVMVNELIHLTTLPISHCMPHVSLITHIWSAFPSNPHPKRHDFSKHNLLLLIMCLVCCFVDYSCVRSRCFGLYSVFFVSLHNPQVILVLVSWMLLWKYQLHIDMDMNTTKWDT